MALHFVAPSHRQPGQKYTTHENMFLTVETNKVIWRAKADPSHLVSSHVAFFRDQAHKIRIWNADLKCVQTIQTRDKIKRLLAIPCRNQVVSGDFEGTIRVWDVFTGKCMQTLLGHTDSITCLLFVPNGGHLASGSRDTSIRIWNLDTGVCSGLFEGHIRSVYALSLITPSLGTKCDLKLASVDSFASHLIFWNLTHTWVLQKSNIQNCQCIY